ncbi:hypothetical protein C6P40_001926 [Pichia californica]|uniref:Uncharacterized protein n=1 Tax=Pichia californica TaxID=460514 RepID=A0A9P6WKH9_9ASCO|nr:hypothetical protein C6P42_002190 [[Candida] californica]KAG0687757.1 hypothetical protein C6P40_001926 [[Candida] californica]
MTPISLSSFWFSSQLSTIFFSILALITSSNISYLLAYFSIIISLIISLYQALTADKIKKEYNNNIDKRLKSSNDSINNKQIDLKSIFLNFFKILLTLIEPAKYHPTTPYILLAISYLLICTKFKITLIPYLIFAFFHAINYFKSFILIKLPINNNYKINLKYFCEFINNNYHEPCFKFSVWIQLFSFLNILIWAILTTPFNLLGYYGDNRLIINWLSVYIWYSFIDILQSENLLMKCAINEIVTALDGITADPRLPKNLRENWLKIKNIFRKKDLNHSD